MIGEYLTGRIRATKLRRLSYVVFIGVFVISGLAAVGAQLMQQAAAANDGYTWTEIDDKLQSQLHWYDLASSTDGTKLVATTNKGDVYTSSDSGESWTKRLEGTGTGGSSFAASSSDGTKLAVSSGNSIYTSSDSGETWRKCDDVFNIWRGILSSSDGTRLIAISISGLVYISTDSGDTWAELTAINDAGGLTFNHAAGSSNGEVLVATTYTDLYVSVDFGETWTLSKTITDGQWAGITVSEDGMKLAATVNGGHIYTSSDTGATWIENAEAGVGGWLSITSSSDGARLAIASSLGSIYTSSDSGVTWTNTGAIAAGTVKLSPDGLLLIAAESYGSIYISTDFGNTWTELNAGGTGIRDWSSVAASRDGSRLAAVRSWGSGGYIYTSSDSGATWTTQLGAGKRDWLSIAVSADGMKLAATEFAGYIFTSSDGGATWTEQTGAGFRFWRGSITLSDDGMKLAAANSGGYIYTSSDGGVTWTEQVEVGSRSWSDIVASSDGTKLAAVAYDTGHVYLSYDSGATWEERSVTSTGAFAEIAMSSDGKILLVNNTYSHLLYVSTDFGDTWARPALQHSYGAYTRIYAVAVSADGSRLALLTDSYNTDPANQIFFSDDFGAHITGVSTMGAELLDGLAFAGGDKDLIAFGQASKLIYGQFTATTPGSLYGLDASIMDDTSVHLEWWWYNGIVDGGGLAITGYRVEYSTNNIDWAVYDNASPMDTGTDVTGLQRNTHYYFRVSAINAMGGGAPSSIAEVQTPDYPKPSTVKNVQIVPKNKSATLQWSAYGGDVPIDAYEIQYRKSTEGSWHTAQQTIASNATSFTVSQLTPGQQYEFRIRSYYWVDSEKVVSSWTQESVVNFAEHDLPGALATGIFFKANSAAISEDGKYIIGGFDDGTLHSSNNGGAAWQEDERADSGSMHLMLTVSKDGSKVLRSSGEQSGTSLYKMDTATGTWQTVLSPAGTLWTAGSISNDGQVLYAGGLEMSTFTPLFKKSTDGGATWSDLAPVGANVVVSLAVMDNGVLYATTIGLFDGPSSAQLYKSSDNGATWAQVNLPTATGYIPALVSASADGSNIVVTLINYDEQRATLAGSKDGGATWALGSKQVDTGFWAGSDGLVTYIDGDKIGSYKSSPLVATPYGTPTGENSSGGHSGGGATSQNPESSAGKKPQPQSPSISTGDAPAGSALKVDGGTLADTDTISHTPTFSGQANPFDHIIVTVHSDPVTCETDADASGYWECTLSEDLPAGQHTVLVKVASAADGSVKEYGPYVVTVKEDVTDAPTVTSETPEATTNGKNSGASIWWWVGGIAAVLVAILIIAGIRRSRQSAP